MTMLTMFTSTPDDENEVVKTFKTYYYMKSDMSCQINPFDD